jgi:hypothetical protein
MAEEDFLRSDVKGKPEGHEILWGAVPLGLRSKTC